MFLRPRAAPPTSIHICDNFDFTSERSKNTPVTRSYPLEVVSQVVDPEHLLSRNAIPSYHTTMEPSAYDASTMDAWKPAFGKPEPQHQAAHFMNKPETNDPSHSENFDQTALCELDNAEVDHQVADRLRNLVATDVEQKLMKTMQLTTDSVTLQKKLAIGGLVDVSISGVIESGHLDYSLETKQSNLGDSAMFSDSIICRIINQRSFIAPSYSLSRKLCETKFKSQPYRPAFRKLSVHYTMTIK